MKQKKLLILTMIFALIFGISQNSYAQKDKSLTKDEAIKRLTELTISFSDEKKFQEEQKNREAEFLKNRTAEEIEEDKKFAEMQREEDKKFAEIRHQEDVVRFNKILAENKNLTDDQKAFIRENHKEVSDLVQEKLMEKESARIAKERKKFNDLLIAGLEKSLAKDFNADELNSLVIFFETAEGKKVIKSFAWKLGEMLMPMPDDMKAKLSNEDKEAIKQYSEPYDEFSKTPNGKKFVNSLLVDGYEVAYAQHFKELRELLEKLSEMEDDAEIDEDKLPESLKDDELTTDEINEVFEKYIADNYTKETEKKRGRN